MAGNLVDSVVFSNISATPAAFALFGGQYGFTVHAASWGTVKLQRLAADGTTYVDVQSDTADSFNVVSLPRGTYQIAISSATGVYADVTPVITSIS